MSEIIKYKVTCNYHKPEKAVNALDRVIIRVDGLLPEQTKGKSDE